MTEHFRPRGKHLIAGDWTSGGEAFLSLPVVGEATSYPSGTAAEVDRAVVAAEAAFWSYGYSSRKARAAFLNRIADEIEARGAAITEIAHAETGLPTARLEGERGRTTGQLRFFANCILAGDYLDRRDDPANPDRQPLPKPGIKLVQRPIGPVAVFGASNFPLAFSTAGGDTASALAAGCPVVVKGHPAHPGTGEIVAEAIFEAIRAEGLDPGVFSLIQSNTREAGEALVTHPLIRAVGFTGSLGGGRALFDLAQSRPDPIPFFGELGSVNPQFMLPEAMAARAAEIAKKWTGSLTMGVGQFCTNPAVVFCLDGPDADTFETTASAALKDVSDQPMLTDGIASAYRGGRDRVCKARGVKSLVSSEDGGRNTGPDLFVTSSEQWFANPELHHEVFGPLGILVRMRDADEMLRAAHGLEGQLTATLHMDAGDTPLAKRLMPVLERKAGRILANGFPTGVEVSHAMMHGGPYPASTSVSSTSVGSLAIRRFLRPVAYQDLPEALLPVEFSEG
ncbi:NADP-dependent fatty aldehyde dehydrogenase [Hartmannibacter diazotrophicus]|uniref:NADP-dependent fatty aldehyde dehydrogenase n=1 Tax=Hartmannibacter diazotrophicus TaxID=1482074 RepID=A0A2C9DDB7_9HYPH|nr:aldehyde dehydrogenase (NADP(+)) [Hartmannibacter diazotrophicus]SON58160.1 NADP-dependent fatty aldehyde dehydrogenase [Hartmannibacter diazotrophicus]